MIDGHDPLDLQNAFDELHVVQNGSRPLAIVARTVKGWGAIDEQGMGKHGTPVKKDKLPAVLGELDQTAKDLGVGDYRIGPDELKISPPKYVAPAATLGIGAHSHKPIKIASFAEGAGGRRDGQGRGRRQADRAAQSVWGGAGGARNRGQGQQADRRPRRRREKLDARRVVRQEVPGAIPGVQDRRAEHVHRSRRALRAAGKIPFCSTFAKFVVRAYDQIEMAIISGANLKITGTHAGVTLAADGPSQMSLPDVAFFRSFCHTKNFNGQPAVSYFFPADAVSCYKITELMANIDGACYQRALRAETKMLYKHEDTFEVGGYKVLREGKDFVFVTAGYMVHECLKAADELAKTGKRPR